MTSRYIYTNQRQIQRTVSKPCRACLSHHNHPSTQNNGEAPVKTHQTPVLQVYPQVKVLLSPKYFCDYVLVRQSTSTFQSLANGNRGHLPCLPDRPGIRRCRMSVRTVTTDQANHFIFFDSEQSSPIPTSVLSTRHWGSGFNQCV
jgi:hypothetical protein